MAGAVRAELRKLASVPTTWLGVGLSVVLAGVTAYLMLTLPGDGTLPSPDNPLAGMGTAVIGVVVMACLAAGEEYTPRRRGDGPGVRQITDSLRAVPDRGTFLAAKAIAVGLVTLLATVVSVAAAATVAALVPGGAPPIEGGAVAGVVAYWVLTSWLALGAAVALRSAIPPMLLLIVNHSMVSLSLLLSMLTPLARYLPDAAGMRLFGAIAPLPNLDPLPPLPGALVMATWSLAALGAAWWTLRVRDA